GTFGAPRSAEGGAEVVESSEKAREKNRRHALDLGGRGRGPDRSGTRSQRQGELPSDLIRAGSKGQLDVDAYGRSPDCDAARGEAKVRRFRSARYDARRGGGAVGTLTLR